MTLLAALPGREASSATDINDSGVIVGQSDGKPCLWQNKDAIPVELPRPAGWNNFINFVKLNNKNQAIATIAPTPGPGSPQAILWQNGNAVRLGAPFAQSGYGSFPRDINDAGQVVGMAETGQASVNGSASAIIWTVKEDGSFTYAQLDDLIPEGWGVAEVHGINNKGQILAYIRNPIMNVDMLAILTPK
jgi:uncharacterized membrane protein